MDFSSVQPNAPLLAPLTRGGNLPYRRLCVALGATVTCSEMAYAREILRGSPRERALLRSHASEEAFGAQLASRDPARFVEAGKVAVDAGAQFVDLNCGCPIHDTTKRGMGASLLRKPQRLARILEAGARELGVPVTVKIRTGWSEGKLNASEVCRLAEEAGVAAITLHGRTRNQRYSRSADWDAIGVIAEERSVPVFGNGDVLTWYDAERVLAQSGAAGVMIARAALIKPWIFRELREGRELCLSGAERVAIYHQLCGYFREHFGDDDIGRRRSLGFLAWHFKWFHRYEHLPKAEYAARSAEHPLLQTRLDLGVPEDPLDRVLRSSDEAVHQQIAEALWDAPSVEAAVECLTGLDA